MSVPTWDEIAEDEFWASVPQDLHENAVREYLGTRGDAIDARVTELQKTAEKLVSGGFFGPSIAVSVTAIEVMVQYFCVRPIISGAMLSDLLAQEVSQHVLGTRTYDQRKLLSAILKPWGIDLASVRLQDGNPLWGTFLKIVIEKRNRFVHRGDEVSEAEAALALECVVGFRNEVVLKMADRLEFSIPKTGCWHNIVRDTGLKLKGVPLSDETRYGQIDPFN